MLNSSIGGTHGGEPDVGGVPARKSREATMSREMFLGKANAWSWRLVEPRRTRAKI